MMTKTSGIEFRNVSMAYERKPVLEDVSFHAPAGEITAILGPSGSGKTTCMRLIAGFERPQQGGIALFDTLAASENILLSPSARSVGYCFQEDALWPSLTVQDHIRLPLRNLLSDKTQREQKVQELLQSFGLAEMAQRYPGQLSGGEQKRLSLARALAPEPQALLLDEPLSSVEGPLREELGRMIRGLRTAGRAVILVTHQLDEALAVADRLVILIQGHVHQEGEVEAVFRKPVSREAAQLLGYRNFFPVQNEQEWLYTPFGRFPVSPAHPAGEGAAMVEDLKVQEDAEGQAVVDTSRFAGQGYRVTFRLDNAYYTGVSSAWLETGVPVSAHLNCLPVVLQGRPV